MSAYIFYCILNSMWPDKQRAYSILDVGSYDVNGNLGDILKMSAFSFQRNYTYVGIDRSAGPNVDLIYENEWPVPVETYDVVVSSSCFEHDDFFWETFLSLARSVKPGGFIYISVPSTGFYHGYPVDNWRFYNDSAIALTKWANKNKEDLVLIHTSTIPHNNNDVLRALGMTNMIFMKRLPSGSKESHMDISEYSKAFANYRYDVILASNRYLNILYSLQTYLMLFQLSEQERHDYEKRVAFIYRAMLCRSITEPLSDCASVLLSEQFTYEGMYPSDSFSRNLIGYFTPPFNRKLYSYNEADIADSQNQSVVDYGHLVQVIYSNGYPLEYQSIENTTSMNLGVVRGEITYPIKILIPRYMKGQDNEIEKFAKRICEEFVAAGTRDDYVQSIKNGIASTLESIL